MLRVIAGASIAASLGAATGCGPARFDDPGFRTPTCDEAHRWQAVRGITTATPRTHLLAGGAAMSGEPFLLDEVGERCADAVSSETCEAEVLAALRSRSRIIVSTDGGTLTRFIGRDGAVELLGAIDTPADALLRAWSAGYDMVCGAVGRAAVREVEGGFEVIATQMTEDCDPIVTERLLLFVSSAGDIVVLEREEVSRMEGVCVGRRPEGLAPVSVSASERALGSHLAEIARLEASAVIAFEILERELDALGAPADLLAAVRDARADEVRHAEVMSRLARARGGVVEAPVVAPCPLRDALAIALENAVEGCVRETYGAVVGLHQAACAADPELAAAMQTIAEDELRHSALSWRVAAFVEPRLTPAQRHLVEQARASALVALRAEVAHSVDDALVRELGVPTPEIAMEIARRLEAALADDAACAHPGS